jgi:hypothetical protein
MEDFVINGTAHGSVAQKLMANGFNVNALRTLDTLRKDEWKHYDDVVLPAARQRLVGVSDLMSRGLVYNLPNGMGSTVLEYEDVSDLADAQMSMDAITRGLKDRPEFSIKYLPLPITHYDFALSARVLASSRTLGRPLDTTTAELAAIKVAEKIETTLFRGSSNYSFGGGTLYGYCDVPNRNTVVLPLAWDNGSKTGELILTDVLNMKKASIAAMHYGPWVLYIPTAYETVIDGDFKAGSDKTIRQRILEIGGIMDVKVVDKLAANNVVLVQMTSDVVRIVEAMPLTTVEWSNDGGMMSQFKVMTIMVPQVRFDQNLKSGITHLS